MRAFRNLTWKHLIDSQWMLGLSVLAMFGLSWLNVFRTASLEHRIKEQLARGDTGLMMRFMRNMAGSGTELTSGVIEMAGWNLPFFLIPIIVWAMSRGSIAVAGELERGTMDLVMSRPVPRWTFLLSHVTAALIGLFLLIGGLVAGHAVGIRFNTLETPASTIRLIRPALNLGAVGLVIFGVTLAVSSADSARWRPNLIGSCFTLASFALQIVVNQTGMEDWKYLEKYSIFKAYNPVELFTKGETWVPNVGGLGAIGLGLIVFAFLIFERRDLPAGS